MGKSLEWKTLNGFSKYEISNYGDVRTAVQLRTRLKGHKLKGNINNQGYKMYKITNDDGKKVRISAHRLVALTFIGEHPSDKYQVAHGDGKKLNNHVSNLRWATPMENTLDKFKHGTILKGEDNPRAILTQEQVIEARNDYQGKYGDIARLARKFNVSHSAMFDAIKGTHWREIK